MLDALRRHGSLGAAPRGPWANGVPQVDSRGVDAESLVLQAPWLWALAPALPFNCTQRWTLLFSSAKHGASFRTLSARCLGRPGVAMVVRDKAGGVAARPIVFNVLLFLAHLSGCRHEDNAERKSRDMKCSARTGTRSLHKSIVQMGYCDVAWARGTVFAGESTSFIAQLSPTVHAGAARKSSKPRCCRPFSNDDRLSGRTPPLPTCVRPRPFPRAPCIPLLRPLSPQFRVHKSTGANSNFCWFAEGYQSVPNGVGWGGQAR